MARARFSHSIDALKAIASDALAHARQKGASGCEAEASEGYGQSVTVRRSEVETIEYNRDKGLTVTVYLGKQKGHASTADFAPRAIRDTVEARGFRDRDSVPGLELLADRLRIDVAHEAADVLQLAAPRLVPGDALRLLHRLAQRIRQSERCELLGVELDQALA